MAELLEARRPKQDFYGHGKNAYCSNCRKFIAKIQAKISANGGQRCPDCGRALRQHTRDAKRWRGDHKK